MREILKDRETEKERSLVCGKKEVEFRSWLQMMVYTFAQLSIG